MAFRAGKYVAVSPAITRVAPTAVNLTDAGKLLAKVTPTELALGALGQ